MAKTQILRFSTYSLSLAAIVAIAVACATAPDTVVPPIMDNPPVLTATQRPTETPKPTPTATEVIPKYDLCADWGEASQCPIPWEDIKKGVPGDIARLTGQPFPDTAYNTGRIYLQDDGNGFVYLTWGFWGDPEDKDYRTRPETRPYRWVGFFSTTDDKGRDYLGAVQEWLNPSGRISYLTYIASSFEPGDTYWRQMAVGFPMVNTGFWTSENCETDLYDCEVILDEETNSLLRTWAETGEIPEELEERVLIPNNSTDPVFMPLTP